MIYFTAFIFTLTLSHVARAVPTCGDTVFPKVLYDSTYDAAQQLPLTSDCPFDTKYDNKTGDIRTLACPNLQQFQYFEDIPTFPYIGATFNIEPHNCPMCWKLTNTRTHISIPFAAVDRCETYAIFSKATCDKLGNGPLEAARVPLSVCGFT